MLIKTVTGRIMAIKRKRLYVFAALSIFAALLALILALRLAPWLYAVNTEVRLQLQAPSDTKISVCWDSERAQCLPLVPYSQATQKIAAPGEAADVWMSEIPPRPVYAISIVFNTPVKDAAFGKLTLDSSSLLMFGQVDSAGFDNVEIGPDQFAAHRVTTMVNGGVEYLQADPDGRLMLGHEIQPGPAGTFAALPALELWGLLYSIYLLVATPLYLFPHVLSNRSSTSGTAPVPAYSGWIFVVFGGALVLMPLLVASSGVIFNPYDPYNYLYLATGGGWFSDTRLPGYPLFLSAALWLSHYDLTGVTILQALVLVCSVIACVWILRRWIPQALAVLFVLLCVFSPAQVHWARWILRESLFTSLVLLAVTAATAHFAGHKPHPHRWLLVFAVVSGIAFLVRENGLVLPAALLPALLPDVLNLWGAGHPIWQRVRSAFSLIVPYSIPVIVLGAIYAGFAGYNYVKYGYFQIGIHQTSHAYLAKAIYPGNTDARAFLDPSDSSSPEVKSYLGWPIYSAFILARNQAPGLDPVYMALYPYVNQRMYALGQAKNTFHLAAILNEIGNGLNALVPRQASIAGILRQYNEAIALRSATRYPLQMEDPQAAATNRAMLTQLPMQVKLKPGPVHPASLLVDYYSATQTYSWYGLILILAVLSSLYLLRYGDPALLAPMAVFAANALLLIATRLVDHRYLVNLDVLLILQVVLGLGSWLRSRHTSRKSPAGQ